MSKSRSVKIEIDKFVSGAKGIEFFSKQGSVLPILTFVLFGLLAVTATVQLQAGSQNLYLAERKFVSTDIDLPSRGLFFDRNKNKLTANIAVFTARFPFNQLSADTKPKIQQILIAQKIIDETKFSELWQKATDAKQDLLITNLDSNQAVLLAEAASEWNVDLIPASKRQYYHGYEFAHVIGYVGAPNAEEIKQGALSIEQLGKYRLEKVLQADLNGVIGQSTALGLNTISEVNSQPGNNVVLTIDLNWQTALYRILAAQVNAVGGRTGSAVIMDTNTGNLLADVSYPSFDPNSFVNGISAADYNSLISNKGLPLLDKVAGFQASPGSAFKIITAYAGLQNGVIDENTHIFSNRCIQLGRGFPFCEFGKYFLGDLDIKRALTRSSNIFFCQSMLELSDTKGYDAFIKSARDLGIGEKTGINLDSEAVGILATPEYKQTQFAEPWFDGDICNAVIGQGMTNITPLQLVAAMSTISNGGKYYRPNLVLRIEDQAGNTVRENPAEVIRTIPVDSKAQELLLGGLYNVVNKPEGTAYYYLHKSPGNFIAKTGSAEAFEVIDGKIISRTSGWVVGTFEYQGSKLAYAAQIQYGGGGWNVTQVMQRFANCLFSDFKASCGQ